MNIKTNITINALVIAVATCSQLTLTAAEMNPYLLQQIKTPPRKLPRSRSEVVYSPHAAESNDSNGCPYMEDRAYIDKSRSLFGVFDGHRGDEAVEHIRQTIGTEFDRNNRNLLPTLEAVEKNLQTHKILNSGATAAIAHHEGGRLHFANIGDSRAIVIRNNQVIHATHDHKPSRPDERERILAAGGKLDEYPGCSTLVAGLSVSRTLGDLDLKVSTNRDGTGLIAQPELSTLDLEEDDILVLATDGLWDVFSNEEVAQELASFRTNNNLSPVLKSATNHLIAQAKKRCAEDNITVEIVKFKKQKQANLSCITKLFEEEKKAEEKE